MFRFQSIVCVALLACAGAASQDPPSSLGIFESQSEVGNVLHPGSAEYDAATKTYTISGSGDNMWVAADEFHFVWKKMSAEDLTLTADISALGATGNAHRKGILMIRQSLDGDSAYVDAARHGEGLTSLQFRDSKGAITREIESNVSGPAKLRIEKQGGRFYMWIAAANESLEFAGGSARVEIHAPFYVGLGVCAHDKNAIEKFAFSNVDLTTSVTHPKARYSTVETVLQSGDARAGYVSRDRLTSPGWSADGQSLTFKSGGRHRQAPFTPLRTAAPVGPPVASQPESHVYFTKRGQIWRKTTDAAQPEQITSDDFHNLSPSLSPDGKRLLFLSYSKDPTELSLRLMSLADKSVKTLATFVGDKGSLGPKPWSPDGRRIVFISYQSME